MSVDSGLPDFASDQGIIQRIIKDNKNMDYRDIINPKYFKAHPQKFWYIYGDRYNQYKKALPHQGYHLLRELCMNDKKGEYFVHTSNVDNMWSKAGFPQDKIYELHGNIFNL